MGRLFRKRSRLAVAVALLALVAVSPAAAKAGPPAFAPPRAAIVFLPGPPAGSGGQTMIERLDRYPQLTALGFVSASQGAHTPVQTLIDIGAGARAASSLYDEDPPPLSLAGTGLGGHIVGWERVIQRADEPPVELDPGALGGATRAAGRLVTFIGRAGASGREAIVAADRSGRVQRVRLYRRGSARRTLLTGWSSARLLVAALPRGGEGGAATAALLAARRPGDLVFVIQRPSGQPRRLLAAGAAGLGGGSTLTSSSTRRDGLVISTDIAPTLLERLGVALPDDMAGEPIEAGGDSGAAALDDERRRLAVIGPRRWPVVLGGLAGSIALLYLTATAACALTAVGRRRSGRKDGAAAGHLARPARCALLAALWLPAVLLVTGALAPSAGLELTLVAFACAALAQITDTLLPWPRSIVVPATLTTLAHLVDLVLGSQLIVRSLLGPNPLLGARFYGIGNELESALAAVALLGLGAAVAVAPARRRVWAFAAGGGALALLLGWGRLGADVGAVLTLGVGAATGALLAADRGPGRAWAALVLVVPALGIAALAALDLATGGEAHFTRSVLRAGGLRELGDVAQRRFELSYHSLGRGLIGPLVLVAAALLMMGLYCRNRLLAPIDGMPGMRAGVYAALAAVVAGALTNDSGPIIFLIGTTYLLLAVGFISAAPKPVAAGPVEPTQPVEIRHPR